MAKTKTYIVQYKMPLGLENPKINISTPNTPQEFDLTEGEVTMLRRLIPDIKCVPANKAEEKKEEAKPEPKAKKEKKSAEKVETSKEEETDSEDSPKDGKPESPNEGDESGGKEGSENDEASEEDAEPKESGTELPEDFPGREHLIAAELDTIEKVTEFKLNNNLVEISGIGSVTADKISDLLVS